jgi:hypothetical protein
MAFRRSDIDFQTLGSIAPFMDLPEDGVPDRERPFRGWLALVRRLPHFPDRPNVGHAGGSLVPAGWRDSSLRGSRQCRRKSGQGKEMRPIVDQ